jgi:hypothetical protein
VSLKLYTVLLELLRKSVRLSSDIQFVKYEIGSCCLCKDSWTSASFIQFLLHELRSAVSVTSIYRTTTEKKNSVTTVQSNGIQPEVKLNYEDKMGWHIAHTHRRKEKCIKHLTWNLWKEDTVLELCVGRVHIVNIDLKDQVFDDVDGIQRSQDRVCWRVFANTVMNLQMP